MHTRLTRREVLLGSVTLGALALGVSVAAPACERDGVIPPDRGKVLVDLAANVIVPAYTDAAAQAKALADSVIALRDFPSGEGLAAARGAWRKARTSWKVTDAFLFGPADDLALTGGVIDTPSDIAKLDALANGSTPLDAGAVAKLGANMRGFGGVEVLLFDPGRDDAAMLAAFESGDRRRGALAALIAADLHAKIESVRAAWAGPPADYAAHLARAGRGSSVYTSERQGVDAVVNALIAAAEVLIAVRLAKPLGLDTASQAPVPELVESPRSDASIDDLLAVLDGIEMVYLGRRGDAAGLPLADAVAERSPRTDERMRAQLPAAKDAVRRIPGPLRSAVVSQRDVAVAAHSAVRELKRILSSEVAAALGTSVGFNVTDGD